MSDPGRALNILATNLTVVSGDEPRTEAQFEYACMLAEEYSWDDYDTFVREYMHMHRSLWATPELWKEYYIKHVAENLRWKQMQAEHDKKFAICCKCGERVDIQEDPASLIENRCVCEHCRKELGIEAPEGMERLFQQIRSAAE